MAVSQACGSLPLASILDYLEVEFKEYKEGSKRCLNEGEAILNSHHIVCCGVKANPPGSENDIHIFALCLQTSNLKAQPHEVNVILNHEKSVKKGHCSCKAGLSGTCKPVVASLLYTNRYVL